MILGDCGGETVVHQVGKWGQHLAAWLGWVLQLKLSPTRAGTKGWCGSCCQWNVGWSFCQSWVGKSQGQLGIGGCCGESCRGGSSCQSNAGCHLWLSDSGICLRSTVTVLWAVWDAWTSCFRIIIRIQSSCESQYWCWAVYAETFLAFLYYYDINCNLKMIERTWSLSHFSPYSVVCSRH